MIYTYLEDRVIILQTQAHTSSSRTFPTRRCDSGDADAEEKFEAAYKCGVLFGGVPSAHFFQIRVGLAGS